MTTAETLPICPPPPPMRCGLLSMAELNEWERSNLPIVKTISGRDLYFSIMSNFLEKPESGTTPLKSFALKMTDRTMRLRIHEFAQQGLLIVHTHGTDGRARSITPTPKLYELFREHALVISTIFAKRFHYVRKDN